jgi:hypothetical protein
MAEWIRRRRHRVAQWIAANGAENRGSWQFYSADLSELTVPSRPYRCQAGKRQRVVLMVLPLRVEPEFFSSVAADFYFGVSFLDAIGFWNPSIRFWTDDKFDNASALCCKIKQRLAALGCGKASWNDRTLLTAPGHGGPTGRTNKSAHMTSIRYRGRTVPYRRCARGCNGRSPPP